MSFLGPDGVLHLEARLPGGVAVEGDGVAVPEESQEFTVFFGALVNSQAVGEFTEQTRVAFHVEVMKGVGGLVRKTGLQLMQEGLVVAEEGFGEGEATGLVHEVVADAPAAVAEPGENGIAYHLIDTTGTHETERHRLRTVDMPHEAVAQGQVHLGIG